MNTKTSVDHSSSISWLQSLIAGRNLSKFFAVKVNGLVWSWLGLMALGWVMVMSASTSIAEIYTGNAAYFSTRHGIYIVLGIAVAFCISRISLAWWRKTDWLWLFIGSLGLVAVLIPGIGHEDNGSARWLNLGLMKVQPSEIVKLTVGLYISGYLIRRQAEVQNQWSGFIKPLVILGLIVVLLLLEPDFGSTVVISVMVFSMLFFWRFVF